MSKYRLTEKTLSEWLEDIRDVALTVACIGLGGLSITAFLFLLFAMVGMLLK